MAKQGAWLDNKTVVRNYTEAFRYEFRTDTSLKKSHCLSTVAQTVDKSDFGKRQNPILSLFGRYISKT